MKIVIDIPEEFEHDYVSSKFYDYFARVMCAIPECKITGEYEKETTRMFMEAFKESRNIDCEEWSDCCSASDYLKDFSYESMLSENAQHKIKGKG